MDVPAASAPEAGIAKVAVKLRLDDPELATGRTPDIADVEGLRRSPATYEVKRIDPKPTCDKFADRLISAKKR